MKMVTETDFYRVLVVGKAASAAFPETNGKIAFTSVRDGNREIYTMNPDGTNPARLTNSSTNGPESDDDEPAFSPDGTKIAFLSHRTGNDEIFVMNAGKDATEIGVNGLERVVAESDYDSNSQTRAFAECPSGKVVGSGAVIRGGESNGFPNRQTDVVFNALVPDHTYVFVQALEESSTNLNWAVQAVAICATEP
jgi:hypothetical protein